jgi:hypothetical protein
MNMQVSTYADPRCFEVLPQTGSIRHIILPILEHILYAVSASRLDKW